ncbi:hypothetical protein GJ496_011125, partial [Pomphorhynchus laevis]
EMLDARRMTEWGNLNLVDRSDDEEDKGGKITDRIKLPGTRELCKSGRVVDRELDVYCVCICPTGRNMIICTSEGAPLYSLDHLSNFDPFDLKYDATPEQVHFDMNECQFASALDKALRLNNTQLINEVILATPVETIPCIVNRSDSVWIQRLLSFLSTELLSTISIELYMKWIDALLSNHLFALKTQSQAIRPILCELQKNITFRFQLLGNIIANASQMAKYSGQAVNLIRKFDNMKSSKTESHS